MRADEPKPARRRPHILCAGIAVLDQIFRVAAFPDRDAKIRALDFVSVVGGGAANAAIAIARLGGAADRIVTGLQAEGVACACVRMNGRVSPVSAILVDSHGGRTITHHRDELLHGACVADPDQLIADVDGVLADDHYPEFVTPICAAARSSSGTPITTDCDTGPRAT